MKRILFLTFILPLLFMSASLSAQSNRTTTITGTVIDAATLEPLPGALIVVDSTKHAIADEQGKFSVPNVPRKSVDIEVEFLGYELYKQNSLIGGNTFNAGTIRLTPEAKLIDDIIVVGQAVMSTQKGDTVQYNAEAFKVNPDADASDLFSKMPGMSMEDGTITAQGEAVRRVYVDNKLLFGDDASAALSNLPADAVESIQWFDEMTDEAKFTGFDDGERNRALNIVTKHKRNRSTTARLNGGYGFPLGKQDESFDNRFNVSGNFNTFTDKNSIMAYANFSNQPRSFMGGNSGGLSTNRMAGIGYNHTWREDRRLSLNYMFNNNHSSMERLTQQDYFPNSVYESHYYEEESSNKNRNLAHNIGGRFEYVFNKDRIFFTPSFSFSDTKSNSIRDYLETFVRDDTKAQSQNDVLTWSNSKGTNYNIGGSFVYSHVFSKPGRSLSTTIGYNFSDNSTNSWQNDDIKITGDADKLRNLNTLNDSWNRGLRTRISYGEPIAENQRIEFNYAFNYENSKTNRGVYDWIADPNTGELDISQTNNYLRKSFSNSGGIGYNLSMEKTRVNLGVNVRNTKLLKDQIYPTLDKRDHNFVTWEPRAQFTRNITRQKFFRIDYSARTDIPSINNLQNVINSNGVTRLTSGNPNLKPEVTHRVNIRYNASNVEKSTSFYVEARMSTSVNGISNKTSYYNKGDILEDYNNFEVENDNTQLVTPVNMQGYYTASLRASYGFPVKALRSNLNLTASYNYGRTPSYIRETVGAQQVDVKNFANSNGAALGVRLTSNISQNVDFSINSNTTFSYVSNTARANSQYWTETLTARANIIFLGGIVFNTDVTYRYDNNTAAQSGYKEDYIFWNAGLGYKFLPRKNAEIRFTVYDLLNQRKSLSHTVLDQYIQDQWTNNIGRYAMVTFSYRFNSMNTPVTRTSRGEGGNRDNYRPQGPPPGGGPGGMQFRGGPGGGQGNMGPGGGGVRF